MPEPLYKNTHKIFSDAPKFVVPVYQREYSWTECVNDLRQLF
jgi:uncharacterized protein with ParB-like and HNH nuclease domain